MDLLLDKIAYLVQITPFVLQGLVLTFKLYVIVLILAIPLGGVAAMGKISAPKPIKWFFGFYTWLIRGTPMMLQLFFFAFALPILGVKLPIFLAACCAYILNYGAYFTEIFRGGLQSIHKGQYEAAKALGLSYRQTMMHVIIPQTIRRVLPPTCNEAINLLKDTPLLAAIGLQDMLRISKQIFTRDMDITAYVLVFAIYLLLSSVLVKVFKQLENHFSIS